MPAAIARPDLAASDTAVDIPVLLPNLHRDVRLTRSELEDMLRPSLLETTESPDEPGSAGELAWVEVPQAADEPTARLHESEPQDDETAIALTEGGPIDVGTVTPAPPAERRVLSRTALVAAVAVDLCRRWWRGVALRPHRPR